MLAFPGPPLTDATPEAWLAYADFLQEEGRPEAEWLQALRFAERLRRRPRLVLVGQKREEEARRERMLAWLDFLRDWIMLEGEAPPRLAGFPVAPPGLGGEGERLWLRPWRKQGEGGWEALRAWQWVTPRGWLNAAGTAARRHWLAALGTTPGELPGLVEARPDVALAFFRKAAEGLRVELREGLPWLVARPRGKPPEYAGRRTRGA
jgi:hypothetical protein